MVEDRSRPRRRSNSNPGQSPFRRAIGFLTRRYNIDSLDNRNEEWTGWIARWAGRVVVPYHRGQVRGIDAVPEGPCLFVGNHNGGAVNQDTLILFHALCNRYGIGAVPYGLGHEVVLKLPVFHQLFVPGGAVRASHHNAERLLGAGRKVLVYPGGDLDNFRPFRHRHRIVFGGRRGYIRLALRARVPILPVVATGAHSTFVVLDDMRWLARLMRTNRWARTKAWPLILSLPWGITLGPLPFHFPLPAKITVEILKPIRFPRYGEKAAGDDSYVKSCADEVEAAMQTALSRLAEA
ncbi:MAG: 1-acyl-sn-glycerol-3-phosphate acyltransferase [Nitrospirae bacterium]|nr:1-acyl-sn-glycerol-3-phosphate acyltransferase [Nitrospirota bacterium]